MFVQGSIWPINIGQSSNTPVSINSVQINPQGPVASGMIQLTLIDTNGQSNGPYSTQMNSGSFLTFSNFPAIPVSTIQIAFSTGIPSATIQAIVTVCPITNDQSVPSISLFFSAKSK